MKPTNILNKNLIQLVPGQHFKLWHIIPIVVMCVFIYGLCVMWSVL